MGLLDRPDSTLLLVIMGVCIVGLLLLAVATFFPGLTARLRPGNGADAYPTEPVQLGDRLTAAGYDADAAEPAVDPVESVTVVPAPAGTTTTTTTTKRTPAKRTAAKKTTAKRAPAKAATRTRSRTSPQD